MAVQIQLRNDTAANWTSENPTLAAGELGIETDTSLMKIGDGTTAWTSLGYFTPDVNSVAAQIIDSAPSTLDTLNELAAALGDDSNFSTTVTNSLAGKQNIVAGVSDTEIGYLDGVTSGIQAQLDGKAASLQSINYHNSDYTLQSSDENKLLLLDTNCTTLTVPGSTFPDGGRVDIVYNGTATLTIAAGAGLTSIRSKNSAVTIDTQYAAATLFFYGAGDRIYLIGDLA